ncbi:tripartite tricarboxylate transporter substrate binding protein [Paeniglutamicibacter psychrophenolicus]|uniref:Tripartite-type tricarboxylate transporter receptor subunit TctC n=1 Tax=Paeniglutamicibacter psychrophenolicus TaxID=257454 RepID=A0ABS4WHG4_9MICC|nr:tripartite tricarboxylate transporter substrate binding protein [Paeniglutamicibacter psychrophenolicus]MBP2375650.1 tripartite-type tricarboxylate transporter receptor subunit TctC [Paeniglutamicibacter psychrophenolicus]
MIKNRFQTAVASLGIAGMALSVAACSSPSAASTEEYPSQPVTFMMPYAAGGPSDTTARSYGACLGKQLGGTFVVENQESGAGAVAMQKVASAKPDGYTVGLSTNGPLVLNPMSNDLSYSRKDFRALGTMAEIPTLFAVSKNSEYHDIKSLFDAAKANPGTISIGVPGATSSLAIELKRLQQDTGIEFALVPTSGSTELITNLLGGHIDAGFINDHVDVESQVKAGAIVPLAAAGLVRSEAYPEVPTTIEAGYDVKTTSVYGLFAPKDLPDEIASKIETGVKTCLTDEDVIKQIGDRFVPNEFTDGAGTAKVFEDMESRYAPILSK